MSIFTCKNNSLDQDSHNEFILGKLRSAISFLHGTLNSDQAKYSFNGCNVIPVEMHRGDG